MNKYNPKTHHRRSIRLKGYDYSQAGLYFITICVQDRRCIFGRITFNEMILNDFGMVAHQQWENLPQLFPNMDLGAFQIMPNHMHGIISLHSLPAGAVRATLTVALGNIVGAYKSLVANECLKIHKQKHPDETMGKLWQRNYYEHIIRDETSYQRISAYIANNPKNWTGDKFK